MSNEYLEFNLGCFKCGELSNHPTNQITSILKCPKCGNQNDSIELLIDTLHGKNQKINRITESKDEQIKILEEALRMFTEWPGVKNGAIKKMISSNDEVIYAMETLKKARQALATVEQIRGEK